MTSHDVLFESFCVFLFGSVLDLYGVFAIFADLYKDLGGVQAFFIFTPNLGEDSNFDEHIFQLGGSTTNSRNLKGVFAQEQLGRLPVTCHQEKESGEVPGMAMAFFFEKNYCIQSDDMKSDLIDLCNR